jgi:hypothetical protein
MKVLLSWEPEALPFLATEEEGQAFDKLRPNGVQCQRDEV